MMNNFLNCFRLFIGLKFITFLLTILISIFLFYQIIITMFLPCFINVFIILIEYLLLICLFFYTVFF